MQRLWVDQDGVLASFIEGHFDAFGWRPPEKDDEGPEPAWDRMGPNFYANLPPMHDFDVLWGAIRHRVAGILTAIPKSGTANVILAKHDWARRYCHNHRGVPVPVVPCLPGTPKARLCQPGDILVDDWAYKHQEPWEAAGGTFVHHKSAEETIERLRELGVI